MALTTTNMRAHLPQTHTKTQPKLDSLGNNRRITFVRQTQRTESPETKMVRNFPEALSIKDKHDKAQILRDSGKDLKAIFDNDTESEHGRYRAVDLFIIYSSHYTRGERGGADS